MQVQSVRFSAEQWAMIQEVARSQGVSAGQFVREAAVTRAIAIAVQRGGYDSVRVWLRTMDMLNEHGVDALEYAYAQHQGDG